MKGIAAKAITAATKSRSTSKIFPTIVNACKRGGNVIEIVVVRQYTVSMDSSSAEGITVTATLNGSESVDLSATVDDGTEVALIISLGSLADTKIISDVTYTVEGGNAVSILNDDGTVKNFNVTDNISICVTLADKPNEVKVEQSTFTSVSGHVGGDANVSYIAEKGDAATAPAVNSGEIRVYQNGGLFTISVSEGKKIKSVTIGSSMVTTIAYTTSSSSTESASQALAANGKIELSFEDGITFITFICKGTTKNTRLYVNYVSVTYA